jgi:hypothetical protein
VCVAVAAAAVVQIFVFLKKIRQRGARRRSAAREKARARPTVRAVGASARGVGDRTARDARRRANERGKK